jgi:hypothetical protein
LAQHFAKSKVITTRKKNKMTKLKLKYKEWQLSVAQLVIAKQKEKILILQKDINQIHQQMIEEARLKSLKHPKAEK